jgi:DNA-binding beta-propeller fold protein YncE
LKEGQRLAHFEPSNGDRFVDDVFLSKGGDTLYVSRSNLGDVAAFDMANPSHPILWRTDVAMFKADHATLSPDGARIVVSASLADEAQVLDAHTGAIVASFATGHFPHQNDYSADGSLVYNGSIGDVSLPFAEDAKKGARQLTVVDATTWAVTRTYTFPEGLRPTVVTPDGATLYAQLSYRNGLVKVDLSAGAAWSSAVPAAIVAQVDEPPSAFAKANYPAPDDYPHNVAHHGLALSGDGARLCDAGTIDDTVSIVTTADMRVEATTDVGRLPYWATTSQDGTQCLVSLSGDDAIAVIDYATAREVKRVPVGKFPQRSRLGRLAEAAVPTLTPAARY